jgi:hypothetical protein
MKHVKRNITLGFAVVLLGACDARVSTTPPEKVIEKNTTIVNPPAKDEKKVESNTTIINPPAASTKEEKKTTTTTTTDK